MLTIRRFTFNPFDEHTFLVYDGEKKEGIVIDPGMLYPWENETFDNFVEKAGVTLRGVINTHLHLDHCFGDNHVRQRYGVKVYAHRREAELGQRLSEQMERFGMREKVEGVRIDEELQGEDIVEVGRYQFKVIEVPGHSPGGIMLYCEEEGVAFVGDTIFRGSIGRTDLGGDYEELMKSIKREIFGLPEGTMLYPGHGERTTVGAEKVNNRFVV